MAYQSWSVVFGEQPSASKWGILGTNDATFDTYIGSGTNAIQQVQYQLTGAVASGTGTIPLDDTIPQSGEGTQFLTKAITPKSATNILRIDTVLNLYFNGSAVHMIGALFQDSVANALASGVGYIAASGGDIIISFTHLMVAGTTSATTFKVRAGGNNAGTTVINGTAGPTRWLGGVAASSLIITEYKV